MPGDSFPLASLSDWFNAANERARASTRQDELQPLTSQYYEGARDLGRSGIDDLSYGNVVQGLPKYMLGSAGMIGAPLGAAADYFIEGPLTKMTGNPDFGRKAGLLAGLPETGGVSALAKTLAMAGGIPKAAEAAGALSKTAEAARMSPLGFTPETLARAKEGGFYTDMPLYHGSGQTFDAFRAVPTSAGGMATPGVSLARNPGVANEFAGNAQANPQIYRVVHRADRPAVLDLRGDETHHEMVATLRNAFDNGHDAVMLRNYTTPAGKEGEKIVIVRDANQLRSPYAEFDPAKRSHANLMASLIGATAIPAAGMAITSAQRQ